MDVTSPLRRWLARLLGGLPRAPLQAAEAPSSFRFAADRGALAPRPSRRSDAASLQRVLARAARPLEPGAAARQPGPPRARLAVDDGGDWLVVVGAEVVLGHARAGAADVGLLADIDARHVQLQLLESFHGGATWHLAALGRRPARVEGPGGRDVAPGERAPLSDGARITLAPKLSFSFHRPDPGSASAWLGLEHGAESDGASRVLLLVPGREGRAVIGPARSAHVQVSGLTHEVELAAALAAAGGATLAVRCAGGVRALDEPAGTARAIEVVLPCPPSSRVDLAVAARSSPPFVVALAPPTA